ncbi:MAG: hypothetical protein COZ12_03550 [Deltaproteobacteria bacterium CG_4_10_14_3_um_filter_60_8]|nr:MAG: hypothetical protein AUK28_06375 [Desulfobacterales bacterium CG2_30_60_27]PIP43881.1 MAG: hypothetical protein COX17_04570 [Deltaproteobacteria bacterium CG23_combo_of_CG06-09_8_20_14_all_60_8]PIY22126.1 MAG: hypothetical protein COZ12_03550 [Deltaproteobacteria bacterium CG_4_10_14_3_um_filter_60_8]
MTSKEFERVVFTELAGEPGPVPAGLFTLDLDLGVGRFQYGRRYLQRANAIPLDPVNLPLTGAEYLTRKNHGIFGVIGDVLPDSWGRYILAKERNVPFGALRDYEFIDLASTQTVGALSFGATPDQPTSKAREAVSLAELGEVARLFERAMAEEPLPPEILYLLRQGTSLGGAQPKCPVNIDGEAWIAKFASSKTVVKYPAIEFATMTLAAKSGIRVPEIRLEVVGGRAVFLIKRFDRVAGARIPFLSAMAVSDLDVDELEQASYPELAGRMRKFVENVQMEQHELFRRMAFNMHVRNEDDHPRNHGFIYRNGWSLSPAFDILPMPARAGSATFHLALQVGDFGSEASLQNLLSRHERFSLTRKEAMTIILEVRDSLTNWEQEMRRAGVSRPDLESIRWSFAGFRR